MLTANYVTWDGKNVRKLRINIYGRVLREQSTGNEYSQNKDRKYFYFFIFSDATKCPFVDLVVLPPGHGRSVTDF